MVFLQDGPPTTYKYWPISPLIRINNPQLPIYNCHFTGVTYNSAFTTIDSPIFCGSFLVGQAPGRRCSSCLTCQAFRIAGGGLALPTQHAAAVNFWAPGRVENLDMVGWKVTIFFCRRYHLQRVVFPLSFLVFEGEYTEIE